jgi:2-C-methyl-D-erythritol 2,4-cyclodiphosphate synthase
MMNIRVGHGYDAHRFDQESTTVELTSIWLGGIEIPHNQCIVAHSDGDVLIHALCDAILGAIGAGDIGQHFPDSDAAFENIASTRLLEQVMAMAAVEDWQVINADITVIAQAPKLAPFTAAMREGLSAQIQVSKDCVNIKATTTEGLGFEGREEGIAAHVVVLLGQA